MLKKINTIAYARFFITFDAGMKLQKQTYFSVFFLLCFIASFSTGTYKNLQTSVSKSDLQHQRYLSFSSQEKNSMADASFLFEENENESENDFEAQILLLPFFISYFQYEVALPNLIPSEPLADKLTNSIYIRICNLRI